MSSTVAPSSAADLFERAVRQHVGGKLAAAARLYRDTLAADPEHAQACNNLGTIVAEQEGGTGEALALFQRAAALTPRYGEATHNIGLVLSRRGEHDQAYHAFAAACAFEPDRADWLNDLAHNAVERFRFDDALVHFDRAIALRPDDAEFWNNRALALRGLRRNWEALESLQQSLRLNPNGLNALSNLGVLLREERRIPEAITAFERAVRLAPRHAAVLCNYASVFELTGDFTRVRALATRALRAAPDCGEAYVLLANAALEGAQYDECRALLDRALDVEPNNRNAAWNRAIVSLLHGDFADGWRQFEARKLLQSSLIDHASYDAPEWDGQPLGGRTILVHTEQGIGDAIQFIRLAAHLKERGAGTVIVECPFPIAPLIAGVAGVDQVIARGTPLPPYDVHVFLMSLPHLLGLTIDTIPAAVPYIATEPRPIAALIDAPPEAFKIGIVWQGNPAHHRDRLRSVDLERFVALADLPGTAWYSLQKDDGQADGLFARTRGRMTDLGSQLADLRDTAAILERLDLVISVDTSVAHLAGALGRPTWTLLPHVPDFRWMLDRNDSPWYPTMRLFRQPRPGDWDTLFAEVARALQLAVRERSSGIPRAVGSDEPTTQLVAAERFGDGRPRFDLWIPLAMLADQRSFAAYEAELLGVGYDVAVRRFWDEALVVADAFVDCAPGLGISLLAVLTGPTSLPVFAVEADAVARRRLERLAHARGLGGRLTACADIESALPDRRLAVRTESAEQLAAVVSLVVSGGSLRSLAALSISGELPERCRAALAPLTQRGYLAFEVTVVDGEVSLDPLVSWDRRQDVVVLSADVLARLSHGARRSTPTSTASVPARQPLEATPVASPRIGIDWELRPDTGWGVYGINLALELAARHDVTPLLTSVDFTDCAPVDRWRLGGLPQVRLPPSGRVDVDAVMLRALGNNAGSGPTWNRLTGRRNAGVIFFEDSVIDPQALEVLASLDAVIAGSTWNGELLTGAGLTEVHVIPQGVDGSIFHPAPSSDRLDGRFVIFSGGKLEYRKAQDLVVAAFRRFRERHPDALLVTAWHNPWSQLLVDLDRAGHVHGRPVVTNGVLDVASWLERNGIPRSAAIDVGRTPNAMMGRVIREAHVALFPNRCEGGTNLVAMECLASGVPTIVSSNTGHLDLVATGGTIPLRRQRPITPPQHFFRGTEGWGESDVDEIVDILERLHADRAARHDAASRGVDAMRGWSWRVQADRLVTALHPLL